MGIPSERGFNSLRGEEQLLLINDCPHLSSPSRERTTVELRLKVALYHTFPPWEVGRQYSHKTSMTLTQPLFLFNFRDFILDTGISEFLDVRP